MRDQTIGGIHRHHHRPDLEKWYADNLDEQIAMMDSDTIDVLGVLREVEKLQMINREIDRRLRPVVMPGRVDIFTELKEVN